MTEVKCSRCGAALDGQKACPICSGTHNTTVSFKNGGVLLRLAAALVDVILLSCPIAIILWLKLPWWSLLLAYAALLEMGYRLHGSVGKSLSGLAVEVTGRKNYYLREVVGKFASFLTFGIGFLMIFGDEGLALHDLIARSRVTRAQRRSLALQRLGLGSVAVVIVVGAFWAGKLAASRESVSPESASQKDSFSAIAREIPAVMTIYCYDKQNRPIAQGSGFLIDANGVGVTNFHVLKTAFRAEARLGDGRIYQILSIHAFDTDKDLVVLRIGRQIRDKIEWAHDLPFLPIGSTEAVAAGDRIAIISSPEGLSNSVTDGLVSAVRADEGGNFLQITAPVSPGSSGGPVLNMQGKVIGVTVAQMREGQNLNFAIPIETVLEVNKHDLNLDFDEFRAALSSPNKAPSQGSDVSLNRKDAAAPCGVVLKLDTTGFEKLDLINRLSDVVNASNFTEEESKQMASDKGMDDDAFSAYSLAYLTWDKPTGISRADFDKKIDDSVRSTDLTNLSEVEKAGFDAYFVKYKDMMLRAFDLGRRDAEMSPCPY